MPKKRPVTQSQKEFFAEEMAKAEAKWNKLTHTPKPVGRPCHWDLDREAISEIAKVNAGVSAPDFDIWTQAQWVKAVGAFKNEKVPGKATIKKHLKEYIKRTPFPSHLIPFSVIQAKPIQYQLQHWYGIALLTVMSSVKPKNPNPSIETIVVSLPLSMIDATHRKLCTKYIPKAVRPTEEQRKSRLIEQFSSISPTRQGAVCH
jgi:hypothetical protein